MAEPERERIACHDCDLLHQEPRVEAGMTARCRRCGAVLRRRQRDALERTLALTFGAAVLFVVANAFPFLRFELKGNVTETTLATGVVDLYLGGKWELAILVAVTTIVAPLAQILLLLFVLLPLRVGLRAPLLVPAFRWLGRVAPWSMMEVFILGMGVAVIKLSAMAEVVPGPALFSFVALMLAVAGAMSSLDRDDVWGRLEALP